MKKAIRRFTAIYSGSRRAKADVEVWAYCLMPNHVHLILNPQQADGLGRAVGEAHRHYTNFINARGRWTGHLFQEFRGQTESVSEIDLSLFRINNLQNLLF